MHQQISLLDLLMMGLSEVYLMRECIPIHGKTLYTSVMLPPLLAKLVHLKKMMITAGAATIVP